MSAEKQVIDLLNSYNSRNIHISVESDLFLDIGLDSLSFIELIYDVERQFNLSIKLFEISKCVNVGNLITLVENKLKEN